MANKLVFLNIMRQCPLVMPFQSSAQALGSEHYTIDSLGIPGSLLMENAGSEVAKRVIAHIDGPTCILIFAGPGKNGGDALVSARHLLAHRLELTLCLISESSRIAPELADELKRIKHISSNDHQSSLRIIDNPQDIIIDPSKHSKIIIIDGIFGAGLNRAPMGPYLVAIKKINELRDSLSAMIFSIDVPSGCSYEASIPKGASVMANETLTFSLLKRCHVSEPSKKWIGRALVRPIGLFVKELPDHYLIKAHASLLFLLKPLTASQHKGNFGHIAVLEGEKNFKGAARLAAQAALRAGAGLVSIITKGQESLHPADLAEFIKRPADETDAQWWQRISVLILGPGLGPNPNYAAQLLLKAQSEVAAIVLDAEGLKLLKLDQKLKSEVLVCTPHPKEAADILGISTEAVENNRFLAIENLAKLAIKEGVPAIWVLKGATTLVHQHGSPIFAFEGGLPILAVGGSGDVLAGIIAALIPQSLCPLAATLLAINLQIKAASIAQKNQSRGLLPSELADLLPPLLKRPTI